MTSPLGRAIEETTRFRVQDATPWVRMGVESTCTFDDLPLKPLTATRTTYLQVVVSRIQGAKYPMPKLDALVPKFANKDYITVGPQCGIWTKLDDIQSYQIACIPNETAFDLIKMIRFKQPSTPTRTWWICRRSPAKARHQRSCESSSCRWVATRSHLYLRENPIAQLHITT